VPGKDIAAIRLAEIFGVVRALHGGRLAITIRSVGPAAALMKEVESAGEKLLWDRSLKDLITAKA
jgi:hypothetical protein